MFEDYGDLLTVDEFCEMLSIGKNGAYLFSPLMKLESCL